MGGFKMKRNRCGPTGDGASTATPAQQSSGSSSTELRPFRVEISDAAIVDLGERLAGTRWPEKELVSDWSMGIPLAYVQELAEYWEKSYDMQRVADRLNRYEQFMTTMDGVDVHFLWVRSPVAGATPCIMTHGWPGSVMEFTKVIDPLVDPLSDGGEASDALELVIPSLPGHGWSGKPTVTG
jgi:epoxide hydrolase